MSADVQSVVHAFCTTYYHLGQTFAFCRRLQTQGMQPELTVFRGKFRGAFTIQTNSLDLEKCGFPVRLHDLPDTLDPSFLSSTVKLLIRTRRHGAHRNVILNPEGPNLRFLAFLFANGNGPDTFVSLEDGVGTYGSVIHRSRAKSRESGRSMVPFLVVGTIKAYLSYLMTARSGGTVSILPAKHRSARPLTLASELREIMSTGIFRCSSKELSPRTVLFLSQPCVEVGLLSPKCYQDILVTLAATVARKGETFVIKPHPSEDLTKFAGFHTVSDHGPVEALLGTNRDQIVSVIGLASTALILASRVFTVPAFQLCHPGLENLYRTAIDESIRTLLSDATQPFHLR